MLGLFKKCSVLSIFKMYLFQNVRVLFLICVVVNACLITGFVVRNIHHPFFDFVRSPVLLVVDLPRELYASFVSGLETNRPKVPTAARDLEVDFSLLPDNLIFKHKGVVYQKGKAIDFEMDTSGTVYISEGLKFLLKKEGGELVKYENPTREPKVAWRSQAKHWHHEFHVDDDGLIYSPTFFPMNGENGLVVEEAKLLNEILLRDNSPPYSGHVSNGENFWDDGVVVLSKDGQVIHKQSLTDLFAKNGLLPVIYAGGLESDPYHLNSVYPLKFDFGSFRKGDLLLSLRHQSMLLIYRPETLKILWSKVGPWSNQHSAKFDNDGNIYLFDNNLIETHYARRREYGFIDGDNEILVHDIETGSTTKLGICVDGNDYWTVTGGRVTITNRLMLLEYPNIATNVICDLETKQSMILPASHDENGRAIAGGQIEILYFGEGVDD